jgi:hypothetical protein
MDDLLPKPSPKAQLKLALEWLRMMEIESPVDATPSTAAGSSRSKRSLPYGVPGIGKGRREALLRVRMEAKTGFFQEPSMRLLFSTLEIKVAI